MWFKDHPQIYQQLQSEIIEEQIPLEEVRESIFQNGTFEELASIKKWISKLVARKAKQHSIRSFVGVIKKVCKGELPHGNKISEWSLKHPDRLQLKDALEYLVELEKIKCYKRNHRLALRNFLRSRNIEGWDEISGTIEEAGKFSHLYAPKDKLNEIFDYVDSLNHDAYLASKFAFKTASRITATLDAHAGDMNPEDKTIWILEKATRGKPKRRQEKLIPNDLWDELPKEGKLFNITKEEINAILRSAYEAIIPDLNKNIPMPFHFWRHQFAQHLLRETDWNYGLVARLGHWTVETLERYYGKMDRKTAFDSGRKHLPQI